MERYAEKRRRERAGKRVNEAIENNDPVVMEKLDKIRGTDWQQSLPVQLTQYN